MPGEENKVEETKTDDVEVKDNVETKDKTDTEVDATDTEKPAADPILESLGDDTQAEKTDEKPVDNEGTEDKEEKTKGEGEEDTDAEAKPDAEQEETKSEEKELDPKEEARKRYEDREQVREERKIRVAQQTEGYVEEGKDDAEKRLRTVEVQGYNQLIEATEDKMVSEFDRVKVDPELQMFNPDNKELFNEKAFGKAIKDYHAGYINYDNNGNMVGIKVSLYQHLKETSEIYSGAVEKGAFKQVRDQRQIKGKGDPKPAVSPKEDTNKDPIMDVLKSD